MAGIRVSASTKEKMTKAGLKLLQLAESGAPGVEVVKHSTASWVPADYVISTAMDALLEKLEAKA